MKFITRQLTRAPRDMIMQDHRNVGTSWMLADRSRCSPLSIVSETLLQESYHLLTKFRFVPDFVLRIRSKPHDQPNNLWRVEPAKAVAFLADRKVVLQLGLATKLVRHYVISLPPFAD